MRQSTLKLLLAACALALPFAGVPGPTAANDSEEQPVRFLIYMNCSDTYTVKRFWLNYKTGNGEKKNIVLERNVRAMYQKNMGGATSFRESYKGTCIDLSKYGKIAPGDEVWLQFAIAGSTKENCRKDGKKLIYTPGSDKAKAFYSGGTSENNNRCKVDKYVSVSGSGQATSCKDLFDRVGTCRWDETEVTGYDPVTDDTGN